MPNWSHEPTNRSPNVRPNWSPKLRSNVRDQNEDKCKIKSPTVRPMFAKCEKGCQMWDQNGDQKCGTWLITLCDQNWSPNVRPNWFPNDSYYVRPNLSVKQNWLLKYETIFVTKCETKMVTYQMWDQNGLPMWDQIGSPNVRPKCDTKMSAQVSHQMWDQNFHQM